MPIISTALFIIAIALIFCAYYFSRRSSLAAREGDTVASRWGFRGAWLTIIGVCLFFGPIFVPNQSSHADLDSMLIAIIGLACIFVGLLMGATSCNLMKRHVRRDYCAKCNYNLAGLSEPRCPECGTRFHPSNISTTRPLQDEENQNGGAK
jgi:drug/metabolite transporter (DMT)-like permease